MRRRRRREVVVDRAYVREGAELKAGGFDVVIVGGRCGEVGVGVGVEVGGRGWAEKMVSSEDEDDDCRQRRREWGRTQRPAA